MSGRGDDGGPGLRAATRFAEVNIDGGAFAAPGARARGAEVEAQALASPGPRTRFAAVDVLFAPAARTAQLEAMEKLLAGQPHLDEVLAPLRPHDMRTCNAPIGLAVHSAAAVRTVEVEQLQATAVRARGAQPDVEARAAHGPV